MPVPRPLAELKGHCSVIYNNTLYAYSPTTFQKIRLEEGAEWEELDQGISIRGAQCVGALTGNRAEDALFIVGGSTDADGDYPGLQRWVYSKSRWEWMGPQTQVTRNRVNHAAVYLNESSSILVYAGSQDGSDGFSSETFQISTKSPFNVVSYSTRVAPPSQAPVLLPWSGDSAVMIGGGGDRKGVYTFSSSDQWRKLPVTLESEVGDPAKVKYTLMFGDDKSKVLEIFDMSVSPNRVGRVALLEKDGLFAPPGRLVAPPRRQRPRAIRRDLRLDNWPQYDDQYAPSAIRDGFSVAQDANGLAVVSGGNTEDPLCIFNQRTNAWVNATEVFTSSAVTGDSNPNDEAPPPQPTGAPVPAGPPASDPGVDRSKSVRALGATLGSVFGLAAILVIILLFLRWKKQKAKRGGGKTIDEKDRLSFADRGHKDLMAEAPAAGVPRGFGQHFNNDSRSSLAIVSGGAGTLGHKRSNRSDASTAGLIQKKTPLGYDEPVEMFKMSEKTPSMEVNAVSSDSLAKDPSSRRYNPIAAPAAAAAGAGKGRTRSSGWSRYFANNEATNLANMQSGRSTYASDRTSSGSQSEYTDSNTPGAAAQQVRPLDIKFHDFEDEQRQSFGRVPKASPSIGNSTEDLRGQPMRAELARAGSPASSISSLGRKDSKGRQSTWTPFDTASGHDRVPSSVYGDSARQSQAVGNTNSTFIVHDAVPRDSTVTVFPRGITSASNVPANGSKKNTGYSDMSWLNLRGET